MLTSCVDDSTQRLAPGAMAASPTTAQQAVVSSGFFTQIEPKELAKVAWQARNTIGRRNRQKNQG